MTAAAVGRWRAAAVAVALGMAALCATARASVPGLFWNDELVYAAAGRHVADGDGPLSSFYHPDSIGARGFPLPDVHMPGQAFVLGAAFRLLGVSEGAAVLTSRLAFLGALLLLVSAVRRSWGERPALATGLLFVLFPPNVPFAHTAMSESVLTLCTAAFLALWLRARERPSLGTAAALAGVIGLALLHHETFLVYVPAAAWVMLRWPRPVKGRALLLGAAVLGACLLLAAPLYLARAPHPHALSDVVLSNEAPVERAGTLLHNLAANLRGLPLWPASAWEWSHALQWLTVLAAAGLGLRAGGLRREVAGLAVLGFLGTWGLLALVYPMGDWRAVRVFMHAMPPALAVIGDALVARPATGWRARQAVRLLAPAALAAVSVASLVSIGRDRAYHRGFGRDYSDFLTRASAGRDVRIVVATKAYRYGWDAYPVAVVVWEATDLKRVRLVEQVLPLDAIVVRREERRRFLRGLEDGAYRRRFAPAAETPFHDRYQLYLAEGERPAVSVPAASGPSRPPG